MKVSWGIRSSQIWEFNWPPTCTDPKGRNLETGGEVWVLLIKTLKTNDSGAYICELNTDPVLRSIHILTGK